MRLKKLYIKDYKNLKDFSLDFENGNGLSILIGNNGSGKSNVLEAISGIFSEWYRKSTYKFDTDYICSYFKNNIDYEISSKNRYLKINSYENNKDFLPNKLIAIYSGENESLCNAFFKPAKDSKKMIFCDKSLWAVSFLLLILYRYTNNDIALFLKEEFDILETTPISITFKLNFKTSQSDKDVENLIEKINTHDLEEFTLTERELQKLLGRINDDDFLYYEPRNLFDIFFRACTVNNSWINKVDIVINSQIHLENLSEGEKKLILIRSILEFVADEDSLILMDEPDANIHESRKICLYNHLKKYTEYGRQIIITTHSPIIAKIASENELVYLESKQGKVDIIETEKLDLIRKLASNEWNIMEAGVFLNSEKPLVLFEGKSDIDFVRRAIELLKDDNPKYAKIDVDFLSFNGTGNAAAFIEDVRNCVNDKKIILFFDRDDSGRNGMAEVFNKDKKSVEIKEFHDFCTVDSLLKASFYPFSNEVNSGEFLIEDYFPERLIKEIINKLLEGKKHPIKEIPNLPKRIKDILANNYHNYSKTDYGGFKPLLDKLIELLEIE